MSATTQMVAACCPREACYVLLMFPIEPSRVDALLAVARPSELKPFSEGVIEFSEALMQLDPIRCGFGMDEISAVEASWRFDDVGFYWNGGFVVRLRDGRRAYIEGSRTPVYDECEPEPETYTLHWEFDVWLIADEPYHSLTPLQPGGAPPVPWQETPPRLNEFLKLLASPA